MCLALTALRPAERPNVLDARNNTILIIDFALWMLEMYSDSIVRVEFPG